MTSEYMILKNKTDNPFDFLNHMIDKSLKTELLQNCSYETITSIEQNKKRSYKLHVFKNNTKYNNQLFNIVKKYIKHKYYDYYFDIVFLQIQDKYLKYINFKFKTLYPVKEHLSKNTIFCLPTIPSSIDNSEDEAHIHRQKIISATFNINNYYRDLILSSKNIDDIKNNLIDDINEIITFNNFYDYFEKEDDEEPEDEENDEDEG